MKKLILILLVVPFLLACETKTSSKNTKEIVNKEKAVKINRTVLGVSLFDNKDDVIKKIKENGYTPKDLYGEGLDYKPKRTTITFDDCNFSGYKFNNVFFQFENDSLYAMGLIKNIRYEDAAKELYSEIKKKMDKKYSKYIQDKKYLNSFTEFGLLSTVYDDNQTTIILMLGEMVGEKRAENWGAIVISYFDSEKLKPEIKENVNKNDF